MSKLIDLTGQRFGRLIVIERCGSHNGSALWRCKCDCGNEKTINGAQLRNGSTRSCGCLQHDIASANMTTHGATIGRNRSRLYGVWAGMLTRTRNSNATNYDYYGGRGIKVCDEWLDFKNFRIWAESNGYDYNAKYGKCTLDRIDDDGDYCPENCRWVDQTAQANNQRSNVNITYNGETHNLKQWSEILCINYSTLKSKIHKGMTIDEIINI